MFSGTYSKNNYTQKETVEIIATNTGIDIDSIIPLPEFLQATDVMDNQFHLSEKYEHLGIIRVDLSGDLTNEDMGIMIQGTMLYFRPDAIDFLHLHTIKYRSLLEQLKAFDYVRWGRRIVSITKKNSSIIDEKQ